MNIVNNGSLIGVPINLYIYKILGYTWLSCEFIETRWVSPMSNFGATESLVMMIHWDHSGRLDSECQHMSDKLCSKIWDLRQQP